MRLSEFRTRSLLATGVAMLVLACSDQGPAAPLGQCDSNVALMVKASLTPTLAWTPACAVSLVAIYPTSGLQPSINPKAVWTIATFERNIIYPPLHYGVDPFGGREGDTLVPPAPPKPLVPGRKYYVILFRGGPGGMGPGLSPGQTTFTPPLSPRSAAQDPVPGVYVQLPPPGVVFPYSVKTTEGIYVIHADTLTIFADLTYQSSGISPGLASVPRTAFTRVGADSLYFPQVGTSYTDMYLRLPGDTLLFRTDTTTSFRPDSVMYVRK